MRYGSSRTHAAKGVKPNSVLPGTERGDVQGTLETVRKPSEGIVVNMGKEEHECVCVRTPDPWFLLIIPQGIHAFPKLQETFVYVSALVDITVQFS
jgi:hypothetical protein